jgi:phosphate/sulfate permease
MREKEGYFGANDVANNVGPAVGSQALSLTGAIIIAVIFEAAGALIAGGDVVSTIKKGIIDPSMISDANTFIWLMMAALLANGSNCCQLGDFTSDGRPDCCRLPLPDKKKNHL